MSEPDDYGRDVDRLIRAEVVAALLVCFFAGGGDWPHALAAGAATIVLGVGAVVVWQPRRMWRDVRREHRRD